MSNPIPGDDAERAVYEYGPEGMPRVERMPDAVLDCLIRDSLFRYFGGSLEGEDRQRLYALMHDTANETLARVSAWPAAPVAADVAADIPTLPEMDDRSTMAHLLETPPAWDDDYKRTWQELQIEASNKRKWRAYALDLRARLAASAPAETVKADHVCENGWIDDPHDIEQGMMKCPKCVATPSPSAEVARDAARWQWMIEKFGQTHLPCFLEDKLSCGYIADGKADIDAVVDDAMAESRAAAPK